MLSSLSLTTKTFPSLGPVTLCSRTEERCVG